MSAYCNAGTATAIVLNLSSNERRIGIGRRDCATYASVVPPYPESKVGIPRKLMTSFHWPIRIYYEDTDSGGIVYYANYLKFMERARTEWLRHIGYEQQRLREQHNRLFVVRAVSIEYDRPARLDDALQVTVDIATVRPASLLFVQKILTEAEVTLCRAQVRVACVDSSTLRPSALPKSLIREISGGN